MIIVNIDKDKLKELYIDKKLSSIKCAYILNCCIATVIKRLRIYNIPVRSISEANKGNVGYWTGKHLSKEHIKNSSEGLKGRVVWNKGFKGCQTHSEETKRKMSKSLNTWYKNNSEEMKRERIRGIINPSIKTRKKLSEAKTGERSSQWKGGISPLNYEIRQSNEYNEWRNNVYQKDYWHCQICGKHCGNKDIIAHHIKSFSEYPNLRFKISNGITLCRNCHAKIHHHNGSFVSKGELAICL